MSAKQQMQAPDFTLPRPNTKHISRSNLAHENPEVWSSIDNLFWDHMKEVQNKWNTLKMNDDIWAKLIYFEQNRRLAKAYVSAPVLTIDGSTNGLDGFRIGLSGIDNEYRSLDSVASLRSIGLGIKLKIDNQGNILIRKIGRTQSAANQCAVFVKDWPPNSLSQPKSSSNIQRAHLTKSDSNSFVDENNCTIRELDQSDASYKLFDMNKFRSQIERRKLDGDNTIDWRQCVSIISFVRTSDIDNKRGKHLLKDPCWLMIINIIAIDMLKNSICDTNSTNPDNSIRRGSSKLVHDQQILSNRSNTQRKSINNNISYPYRASGVDGNRKLTHEPLRSSSSTSVLYSRPSAENNIKPSQARTNNAIEEEKVGKLRINMNARNPNRFASRFNTSIRSDDPYSRQYQSSQQISMSSASSSSANNTIYTTFDSKYIKSMKNPKSKYMNTEYSSTSDYNSASRNSSSNNSYWNYKPTYDQRAYEQRYYPTVQNNSTNNHLRGPTKSSYLVNTRSPSTLTRGSCLPLDARNKSLSISNFNLANGLKSREIRPLQSSIKMNYDNTGSHNERRNVNLDDRKESASRRAIISLNEQSNLQTTTINLNDDDEDEDEDDGVHESPNLQGSSDTSPLPSFCCEHNDGFETTTRNKNQQLDKKLPKPKCELKLSKLDKEKQKVSRSSIASSSSSSGCVDNDYFMSHSSSSMSSSTRSNECELFSQPASSSGIVCSGSTSDECEDGHKLADDKKTNQNLTANCKTSNHKLGSISNTDVGKRKTIGDQARAIKANNHQSNTSERSPRRGYKIKTIAQTPAIDYCCIQGSCSHDPEVNDLGCDCAPVEYECDCCCDCITCETRISPVDPVKINYAKTSSSNRGVDPIYDRLPHPSTVDPRSKGNTDGKSDHSGKRHLSGIERSQRGGSWIQKVSSMTHIGESRELRSKSSSRQNDFEKQADNELSKEKKQNVGWLEKKKYRNILPKFMFNTSSNSRDSNGGYDNGRSKTKDVTFNNRSLDKMLSPHRRVRSSSTLARC